MKPTLHLDSRISDALQDIEALKRKVGELEARLDGVTDALLKYAEGAKNVLEERS